MVYNYDRIVILTGQELSFIVINRNFAENGRVPREVPRSFEGPGIPQIIQDTATLHRLQTGCEEETQHVRTI